MLEMLWDETLGLSLLMVCFVAYKWFPSTPVQILAVVYGLLVAGGMIVSLAGRLRECSRRKQEPGKEA